MVKKQKNETIEKITASEISAMSTLDRLEKLEKEREKNKRVIDEYKDREKASARALVLYERKIKYLKQQAINSLLEICRKTESSKGQYLDLCESIMNFESKQSFKSYGAKYDEIAEAIYKVCDLIETTSSITNEDRAFIANKNVSKTPAKNDIQSRFDRLKQQFDEKIGGSVLRKPGRPRKSEQSIVSDIGLGKKPDKKIAETADTREKINKIFYETPENKGVKSNIPQTTDSAFDFNEALNPNISLKDIMADLMEEKQETPVKSYGSLAPKIEKTKTTGFDSAEERKARVERLEAGIFQTPIFHDRHPVKVEEEKQEKRPSFEQRFMPFKSIMDETRK